MSFALFDRGPRLRPVGARYLPRTWPTRCEADAELWALLQPYPAGHTWRARLHVVECTAAPLRRRARTPWARMLEFGGRSQSITAWEREFGIAHRTIAARLRLGWTVDAALSTPPQRIGRPRTTEQARAEQRGAA